MGWSEEDSSSRQSVSKAREVRKEHSDLYGKSSGRALSKQWPECGEAPGRSQCGKEKEVRSKKSAGVERGPVSCCEVCGFTPMEMHALL